jgi:uncharacterized protein involved in exopolysaccharide biosynthesis
MNDGTLFRPDQRFSGGPRKGGGRGPGNDDDEVQVTLKDRLLEATRSAKRRLGLTVVMLIIGLACTVIAAILAPRQYESEAEILVARTQAIQGGQAFAPTGDEKKDMAREFEAQIMSHDNIVSIVKATELVERWNAMRQPHRRLLDRVGTILGQAPYTDEQKFNVLVQTIEAKLRVNIDSTTVHISVEWSEPEAARDIVQAAVKNFQDSRYGIEVGVIPERVKILEGNVARAKGDVEKAFADLQARQAPTKTEKKTVYVKQGGTTAAAVVTAPGDSPQAQKLAQIDQQIAQLTDQKNQRLNELNQKLTEMSQTYAAGHPDIIALKANIAATQQDSPQLAALKQQDKQLRADMAANPTPSAPSDQPTPERRVAVEVNVQPDPAATPKSIADVQAQFETAQRKYEGLLVQLETARIEQQTAEAAFKHRYSVTHPAEAPAKPKRPVGAIASLVGLLATILVALMVATLADRLSGIFFEPRDVRDRLGLPVFATMKW